MWSTASAPANARPSRSASVTFAVNPSAPRLVNVASFFVSRPTTRTFLPLSSNRFATTEPVFPVAPRLTYMSPPLPRCLRCEDQQEWYCDESRSLQHPIQLFNMRVLTPAFVANE